MTIETLSLQALKQALNLRDLSNPAEGPHAMQLLTDNIIAALERHWQCPATIYRESPVVSIEDNYDRIGYPPDGASRDSRYTRYVCQTALLRTMASAMIPRAMQSVRNQINPNHLLAAVGLCYRRDCIDRSHTGEPHQLDLWYLTEGKPMTTDDLKEMIRIVLTTVNPDIRYRLEPRKHPYTLEGCQVDALWNGQWLEVLECGLAHPKVIKENTGRDDLTGLAMGPGLDRLLMVAKNIPDIRLLRSTDKRIQDQMLDLSVYKEVSGMPSVNRDLSIVVDNETDTEILGDRVKEALGAKADMIEAIKILSETPYDKLPPAAIERLGMCEGQKNILIRIVLRALDRSLTHEECNEYRNLIYSAVHKGTVMMMAS